MKLFSYLTSNNWIYTISIFFIVMSTQCNTASEQKKQYKEDIINTNIIKPKEEKGASLIRLISNPDKFNGKLIRVEGFLTIAFEGTVMYFHKEDYDHGLYENGIWIEISKEDIVSDKFSSLNKKYVLLEGTFNSSNKGHFGKYSGAIEKITRAEAIPARRLTLSK